MNRKIAAAIAALCIIAVFGAAGSIAYRVLSVGEAGRKSAESDFSALLSILSSVRTASDFADNELRGRLAAHFSASPTLLAAEAYQGGGTIWRMPADSPYPLGASADDAKLPASALRLSSTLGIGSADSPRLDAVYVRVSQLSVFTAFRDALVFLAGFLALASIAAAIAARPRTRGREYAVAEGPGFAEDDVESEEEPPRTKHRKKKRHEKTAQREIEELFDNVVDERESQRKTGREFDLEPVRGSELEPEGPAERKHEPEREANREHDNAFEDEAESFDIPHIDIADEPKPDAPSKNLSFDQIEELPDIDLESAESDFDIPSVQGAKEPRIADPDEASVGAEGSGVLPEEELPRRLEAELERMMKAGLDLSVIAVVYDDLSPVVPEYESFVGAMRMIMGSSGIVFKRGRSGFFALLPGADSRRSLVEAEELFMRLDFLSGGDVGELHLMPLYLGISSLAGREADSRTLISEAEAALERAREDPDSHIVAFRPDPEKYRRYLQGKSG